LIVKKRAVHLLFILFRVNRDEFHFFNSRDWVCDTSSVGSFQEEFAKIYKLDCQVKKRDGTFWLCAQKESASDRPWCRDNMKIQFRI
jgi:hypothetical protein